jgi:hypothetical protein
LGESKKDNDDDDDDKNVYKKPPTNRLTNFFHEMYIKITLMGEQRRKGEKMRGKTKKMGNPLFLSFDVIADMD